MFSKISCHKNEVERIKVKAFDFASLFVSNLSKLLIFPNVVKSSSFTAGALERVLCLQPLPYGSSSFNLNLLLICRVATSVFNIFKRILPS